MIRFINTLSLITLILLVGCGAATPRVNRGGDYFPTTTFPTTTGTTVPFSPLGFRCTITADKTEVVPGMSVKFTVIASGAPSGATYIFEGLKSFNVNQSLVPLANASSAVANVQYIGNFFGTDPIVASVRNSIDSAPVTCSLSTVVVRPLALVLTADAQTALNSTGSQITVTASFSGITNPSFFYNVTDSAISVIQSGPVSFTVRPTDNNVHLNVGITITATAGSSSLSKTIVVSFLPALTTRVDISGDQSVGSLVTFTVIATNGIGETFSKVELINPGSFEMVSSTANSVTVRFLPNTQGSYLQNFARIIVTSALRPTMTFENGLSSAILIPAFTIINP